MEMGLKDRIAFVAGSSRGIGRAIAAALLAEGARVVITGRDAASLETARAEMAADAGQDRVLAIAGDFANTETIVAAFEQTVREFGRIDHMVANLGTGSGKPGWEQAEEEWERLFAMNFFASVRLTQAVLPYLLGNAEGGSVLYVGSIVGVEATPAPLPYSAAKAALMNYAKNLARQVGAQKVRVNTIAPGNIYFAGGSWERHLNARREAVEAMLRTEVPVGRFGTPEEIASLAVWLCSEQAGFATGGCFVVDGGQTRSV
ncbi:MAG: SDR family oxidoreductase [Acidobacteria bacterium]|nr:SDR family oxidoreductase [Acidobacteriota bacterium]